MTTLRTIWGSDLQLIKERFGFDLQQSHRDYLASITQKGLAQLNIPLLTLTNRGKLLADQITLDLFVTD